MRIKICGITKPEQGQKIARMGATALGFICVERSPRYVTPSQIKEIIQHLSISVDTIGVFANVEISEITQIVTETGLSGVQLHGSESTEFCQQLRSKLPGKTEIIKAFRIRTAECLSETELYTDYVDTLLLDAYHPQMLGGTGQTINWADLRQFSPTLPWMLAGGLNPDNILAALIKVKPNGIDLSSGVEKSPGDKDLDLVAQLFANLSSRSL
ncbi:phosphoribosylanthranilate isomerase [Xenococcus sp. PCC 7305]|uniref:phosphoribosylanthranilate isomerase n=1 Tax=Xenococcus sp. PCC 7305 TaxID=102125 RepID=UPI0002AC2356|nr:phosphoribosylanthranilate isomerase [Xenococcus sp. PCC 7305]ELS00487.1 phosphoribosylanthranilate isomerase [Xenococcus sp. PCC 7305]